MRGPESRSRISGFCFDCSRWAPEGPLPRLWFPDRKVRSETRRHCFRESSRYGRNGAKVAVRELMGGEEGRREERVGCDPIVL